MWLGGAAFELDTFSYIQSEAGTAAQRWHSDLGALFPQGEREDTPSRATPAHGIVQVTPLVDVDSKNGATQFLCGSHLVEAALTDEELKQLDETKSGRVVSLPVRRTSVAFFDIRLRHRGGPHLGEQPRPILYSSFGETRHAIREALGALTLPARTPYPALAQHLVPPSFHEFVDCGCVRYSSRVVPRRGQLQWEAEPRLGHTPVAPLT